MSLVEVVDSFLYLSELSLTEARARVVQDVFVDEDAEVERPWRALRNLGDAAQLRTRMNTIEYY